MPITRKILSIILSSTALLFCHVALPHATMTSSNPKEGTLIREALNEVSVCFNENISDKFMSLVVVDESGNRIDKGAIKTSAQQNEICLSKQLDELVTGHYLVRYRAQSSDEHVVSGKYKFEFKGTHD